jgi:glycosyltransferase involved in cell wall biosynthesis
MKIAIDISPLETSHAVRGIGVYTDRLTKALHKYQNQHSYIYFSRGQSVPAEADIVHIPYFDPFFLTLRNYSKPTVVTVHDLIPIRHSEHFPRGIRGDIKWKLQKWMLRTADRIITDSLASKNDITEHTQIPEEIIDVIYLAPDGMFSRELSKSNLAKVKTKYRLPTDYLLYTGDVNWNKNIPGFIDAYHLVKTDRRIHAPVRNRLKLVLVGKAFADDQLAEMKEINGKIKALNLTGDVLKVGYVEQLDIPSIYKLASCYIQPSFAEGFGLPPLEAMACGCPVVTSGSSSLAEIAGPSVSAASASPHDLSDAIVRTLRMSVKQRADLLRDCKTWAARFSWEKTARETAAVYQKTYLALR